MEERRRHPRAAFAGRIDLDGPGWRRQARGRDLSRSGVCVTLSAPHPELASEVVGEFQLPGIVVPLALRGQVVWSDPEKGRLGLAFAGLGSPVAELLESYVAGRFGGG